MGIESSPGASQRVAIVDPILEEALECMSGIAIAVLVTSMRPLAGSRCLPGSGNFEESVDC